MSPNTLILIDILVTIIILVIGGAVLWGRTGKSVETNEKAWAEVRKADYIKRQEYEENKKEQCKKGYIKRQEYEVDMANFCKKVEEIKILVREMDTKREAAREARHKELTNIALFMGRMEQFVIDIQSRFEEKS